FQKSSTVTITIASPAVVSWTAHGLTANTPVLFQTSGALPTGITANTIYYVIAAGLGANSFEISATVGGSSINTSGTPSGTHTVWGNPMIFINAPCPRTTITNCTGCLDIEDASNGPANSPMFSYAKRRFVGFLDTNTAYLQPMKVMGTIVSITVNVIKAYTG